MISLQSARHFVASVIKETGTDKHIDTLEAPHPNSSDTVTVDVNCERALNVDLNEDSLLWQFLRPNYIPPEFAVLFRPTTRQGWRSITRPCDEPSHNLLSRILKGYFQKY